MEKQSELLEIYSFNDLNVVHQCELDYLTTKNICFLDSMYELKGKHIYIKYLLTRSRNIKMLKKENSAMYLLNLIDLEKYYCDYDIPFTEDNLFFDFNLIPKFKIRKPCYIKQDYLTKIKIVALWLLERKQPLKHYEISGLFKKYTNKILTEIKEADSLEILFEIIYEKLLYKK